MESPKKAQEICFCRSGEKTQADICTCTCCEHDETMLGNVHARCEYPDCKKCRYKRLPMDQKPRVPQTRMEEMMQDAGIPKEPEYMLPKKWIEYSADIDPVVDFSWLDKLLLGAKKKMDAKNHTPQKWNVDRPRINLNAESDKSPLTLLKRLQGAFRRWVDSPLFEEIEELQKENSNLRENYIYYRDRFHEESTKNLALCEAIQKWNIRTIENEIAENMGQEVTLQDGKKGKLIGYRPSYQKVIVDLGDRQVLEWREQVFPFFPA
jgi:hypothetical protein